MRQQEIGGRGCEGVGGWVSARSRGRGGSVADVEIAASKDQ